MTKSACLQGTIVALMALLLLGCGSSPQAKRDKYVARGKALVEKRDYMRAILEFRNAARAMPGDAEVYYQIGTAYLASGDVRTGYAALRKAAELDPKHRMAQLRIAQLLSMVKDPAALKDAEKRLRELLEGGSEAEVLNALAFTELQLGDTENAIRDYEAALARYPGEITAAVMLARTKLFKGDSKGAEGVLKKACDDSPKSADARRVLAEFYISQKNMAAAEAEIRKALALDSNSGPALLDLGRLLLTAERKSEAEETFRQLRSIEGYQQVYGMFLLEQQRNEEAIREFERLAEENPDDRAARTRLIAVYRRQNRFADADAVLNKALQKNPKDTDALLQRGEIALEAKKFGDAEVNFNQVLKLRPNSAEAHYLTGKLHEARGDRRLYRQELGQALSLNPALARIRVELAQDLILKSDAQAALNLLDEAPEPQKAAPIIMVQRNWALWALGDLAGMRRGIDAVLAVGQSSDALIQDGLWKLRAGDRKAARASVEQALSLDPEDLRALRLMKRTFPEEALAEQKIKEYAAERPKSAAVQEFLGMTLLGRAKWVEARAAFTAALTANPKLESAELSLVQVDVTEKDVEGARKRLESLLNRNPGNLTARRWLGNVEVIRGNNDSAIEHFRKVVEQNPADAQASNNLAYLLLEHRKRPDEALQYAQKAVEIVGDHPAYCDTLGWAYYTKGLYSSAIPLLERASASRETAVYQYHLAMAYTKSGDIARGRATLNAALKVNPKLPEAKMAADLMGAKQ